MMQRQVNFFDAFSWSCEIVYEETKFVFLFVDACSRSIIETRGAWFMRCYL